VAIAEAVAATVAVAAETGVEITAVEAVAEDAKALTVYKILKRCYSQNVQNSENSKKAGLEVLLHAATR
jgi:molybdenum cofactor biosynthesis enzyme